MSELQDASESKAGKTVEVFLDGALVGSSEVVGDQWSLPVTDLKVGEHVLTAKYGGVESEQRSLVVRQRFMEDFEDMEVGPLRVDFNRSFYKGHVWPHAAPKVIEIKAVENYSPLFNKVIRLETSGTSLSNWIVFEMFFLKNGKRVECDVVLNSSSGNSWAEFYLDGVSGTQLEFLRVNTGGLHRLRFGGGVENVSGFRFGLMAGYSGTAELLIDNIELFD